MMRHLQRFLSTLEGVRETPSGFMACCPCSGHSADGKGDDNPSLSIDLGEDNRIIIHCFGGCRTDLILESLGLDYSDLWPSKDDPEEFEADLPAQAQQIVSLSPEIEPRSVLAAPEMINQVYRAILEKISLTPMHRQKLRDRGLEDEQIDRLGYRSLSFFEIRQKGLVALRHEFGDDLLGVPGFIKKRGTVGVVELTGGILIPVRDPAERIVALKIRSDHGGQGGKYFWFSGGGGPSCGSPAHVPLGVKPSGLVRVTEGPLKADIAFLRSGLPTIAIAGVSSWASAIPLLKDLKVEVARLAFDSDVLVNKGVADQLLSFAEALVAEGFEVEFERWSQDGGKGIDDVLTGGGSTEFLAGPEAMLAIRALVNDLPKAKPGQIDADTAEAAPRPLEITLIPATNQASTVDDGIAADLKPGPISRPDGFPLEVFPAVVADFARHLAGSIGCPVDYVAFSQLIVAAAAIGDSRTLFLGGNWYESASIFGGIIGHPGDAKTPAQSAAVRPVYRIQQLLDLDYEGALLVFEEQQEAYEAAVKSHKAGGRSRPKVQGQDDHDDAAGSLPEKPVRPRPDRIITSDPTVESLAPILKQNPRGLLIHRDELSGWARAMNMYRGGKGADRQFFLSGWSSQNVVVDRKSEGTRSIHIPHPFFCILGSIQPDMLTELVDGKGRQDGFLDRILFVFPDTPAGQPWPDKQVPRKVFATWAKILRRLYRLKMKEKVNGMRSPKVLRPTPEALEIFKAWWAIQLAEMRCRTFDRERLGGPFNKFRAHLARLALVVHCLRRACDETDSRDVDGESARRAAKLADYFKAHCIKVHQHLRLAVEDKEAEAILAWIRRNGGRCTARDLCRNEVAGIKKATEAKRMLRDLEDRGFGHCTVAKTGKKESVAFAVGEGVG